MKGVAKPEHLGEQYERPAFLQDKKVAYATAAAKFRQQIGAPQNAQPSKGKQPAAGFDAPLPPHPDDDSSLPF